MRVAHKRVALIVIAFGAVALSLSCCIVPSRRIQGSWSEPELRFTPYFAVAHPTEAQILIGFAYDITQTAKLVKPRTVWKGTDWERENPRRHNTIAKGRDIAVVDLGKGTVSFPEIADWPTDVFSTDASWIFASRQAVVELKEGKVSHLFAPSNTTLKAFHNFSLSTDVITFKASKGWQEIEYELDLSSRKLTEVSRRQVDLANPPRLHNPPVNPTLHAALPHKADDGILDLIEEHFRAYHLGKPGKRNFHNPKNLEWGECRHE